MAAGDHICAHMAISAWGLQSQGVVGGSSLPGQVGLDFCVSMKEGLLWQEPPGRSETRYWGLDSWWNLPEDK